MVPRMQFRIEPDLRPAQREGHYSTPWLLAFGHTLASRPRLRHVNNLRRENGQAHPLRGTLQSSHSGTGVWPRIGIGADGHAEVFQIQYQPAVFVFLTVLDCSQVGHRQYGDKSSSAEPRGAVEQISLHGRVRRLWLAPLGAVAPLAAILGNQMRGVDDTGVRKLISYTGRSLTEFKVCAGRSGTTWLRLRFGHHQLGQEFAGVQNRLSASPMQAFKGLEKISFRPGVNLQITTEISPLRIGSGQMS